MILSSENWYTLESTTEHDVLGFPMLGDIDGYHTEGILSLLDK